MNSIYVTCGENGVYGLRHLLRTGHRFAKVITISSAVAASHKVSGFLDVTHLCREHRLEVVVLDDYEIRPSDIGSQYDLLVVNGWNRLVKGAVLDMFDLGGLGIHAGHPPIGHGRAPIAWNIIKGFRDIEVYVFRMTQNADDGDIVLSQRSEITPFDNARTLYEKIMFVGARLLDNALNQFAIGNCSASPQAVEDIVVYPKRSSADGGIDFFSSVEAVYDFIRAQAHPYPGAYSLLNGSRWTIWRALPFDCHSRFEMTRCPGRVIAALPAGLVVETASTPIWILEASDDNGPVVPAPLDMLEKYVGCRFESINQPRAGSQSTTDR